MEPRTRYAETGDGSRIAYQLFGFAADPNLVSAPGGLFFNTLTNITGTAEDSTSPNNLFTEISIYNQSADEYWQDDDGDEGAGAGAWDVTGTERWIHVSTSAGNPA